MLALTKSSEASLVIPLYRINDIVIVQDLSTTIQFTIVGLVYSTEDRAFVYTLSPTGYASTGTLMAEEHYLSREGDNEPETERQLTLREQYHEDMKQKVLKGVKGVIEDIMDDEGLVVVFDSGGSRQYEGVALTRRIPDYVDAGYEFAVLDEFGIFALKILNRLSFWVRAPTLGGDESD
jgi:hypothetical protein